MGNGSNVFYRWLFFVVISINLSACYQGIKSAEQSNGENIYAPSTLVAGNDCKQWLMGWKEVDQRNDSIYYNTAGCEGVGRLFSVLNTEQLPVKASHVGDPSVTLHQNQTTGKLQYTMFFTVCLYPCLEGADKNENEIWSVVSEDGIGWQYPVRLLAVPQGAAEPFAMLSKSGAGHWMVFYTESLNNSEVKVAQVDGHRKLLSTQTIYLDSQHIGALTGVEMHRLGNRWRLFTNVYRGSKENYRVDIAYIDSANPTQFSGKLTPIVTNGSITGQPCAASTPSVVVKNGEYDLWYAVALRGADGKCINTKHVKIEKERFAFGEDSG